MGAIELVEKSQLTERPAMKSGDTVRVHVKVREGDKERIQVFEGVIHRRAPWGDSRVVYRAQGIVWPGRRAHFPASFSDHSKGRGRAIGQSPPGQAVLPPRFERQGGAHERGWAHRRQELTARPLAGPHAYSGDAHSRERAASRWICVRGRRRRGRTRVPGRSGGGGSCGPASRQTHPGNL